jgi:hypothetical protein
VKTNSNFRRLLVATGFLSKILNVAPKLTKTEIVSYFNEVKSVKILDSLIAAFPDNSKSIDLKDREIKAATDIAIYNRAVVGDNISNYIVAYRGFLSNPKWKKNMTGYPSYLPYNYIRLELRVPQNQDIFHPMTILLSDLYYKRPVTISNPPCVYWRKSPIYDFVGSGRLNSLIWENMYCLYCLSTIKKLPEDSNRLYHFIHTLLQGNYKIVMLYDVEDIYIPISWYFPIFFLCEKEIVDLAVKKLYKKALNDRQSVKSLTLASDSALSFVWRENSDFSPSDHTVGFFLSELYTRGRLDALILMAKARSDMPTSISDNIDEKYLLRFSRDLIARHEYKLVSTDRLSKIFHSTNVLGLIVEIVEIDEELSKYSSSFITIALLRKTYERVRKLLLFDICRYIASIANNYSK